MRFPYHPVRIDDFTASTSGTLCYILSHFHTDHMKGLHASWEGGYIYTTHTTKALLAERFGKAFTDGCPAAASQHPLLGTRSSLRGHTSLAPRVIAINFEVKAWIPFAGGLPYIGDLPAGELNRSSALQRYLQMTFIPAHHIAGSAMVLFPSSLIGCCLYTGDFRYDPATAEGQCLMQSIRFWATEAQKYNGEDDSEPKGLHDSYGYHEDEVSQSLSPKIQAEDAAEAPTDIELDAWLLDTLGEDDSHTKVVDRVQTELVAAELTDLGIDHLFMDDTWLHLATNTPQQVGSGAGFDRLKSKLLTTDQLHKAFASVKTSVMSSLNAGWLSARHRPLILRCYIHNNFGKEHLLVHLARLMGTTVVMDDQRYRLAQACCDPNSPDADVDPSIAAIDIRYFTPWSRRQAELKAYFEQCVHDKEDFVKSLPLPPCCIEVVGSRADISPEALRDAALLEGIDSCVKVKVFGIVMSGWARLQSQSTRSPNLFEIPYSLHTSPEHLVAFVANLRPKSVCQLHWKASRSHILLAKLGMHLRQPYVNSLVEPVRGVPIQLLTNAWVERGGHAGSEQVGGNEFSSVGPAIKIDGSVDGAPSRKKSRGDPVGPLPILRFAELLDSHLSIIYCLFADSITGCFNDANIAPTSSI